MRKLIVAFAVVGFFVYTNPIMAQMSSTNYQIRWDSLSEGGSDTSTSANYGVRDSVGGNAPGSSSSTNYQVSSGYRSGIFDQVITFDLLLQNSSGEQSSLSRVGNTVSTTQTDGFSVGGYALLVQNKGVSQVSALGKIASIAPGSSLTVDSWSTNGTTPTIDGTNDYIYPLNGSTAALGTISSSAVSTSVIGYEVTADLTNGYSVQVMVNGDLASGANTIDAVSDGTVTVGSEEYGAISSDTSISTSTFDSSDTAFTTSFQDITTESSAKYLDRHFLTLKAAGSSGTTSGDYTQSITLIVSGNY